MTLTITILTIALVAVTSVSLWLWRRLVHERRLFHNSTKSFPPLFDEVVSTIDAGLVVIDKERHVLYLNPQAEYLLGVEQAVAINKGIISLIRDYQVDDLVGDVLLDGEAREMVLKPLVAGRTMRLRATPLLGSTTPRVVLLIRDVTQLSMLERARRDMVANVSHELRTPLASIKLIVETLQSEPPQNVAQRMLVRMAQEVDAVTQLVEELHELSQIESGRVALQMAPAPLAPVIERAIERIRPQTERKSLDIHADVAHQLPSVMIDEDRIGQVFLNLLHNAVKFTPEHGSITVQSCIITVDQEMNDKAFIERRIQTSLSENFQPERRHTTLPLSKQGRPTVDIPDDLQPGNWMLISITDTGIGIPVRDLPRIFERFYKVDRARTRNAGGTGLGLAIAKHLIEGHGGYVWAKSEEGSGSTFYFVLPIA